MSWMGSGWDSMDSAWDNVPGKDKGARRLWLPPGETNRIMFLEDNPTTIWEHNYKWDGHWRNWEPCPPRNRLGRECPICDAYDDRYPYFVGFLTIINMTPWFTKKKNTEINFQREIFAAKMGSDEKPGVLKKVRKMADKQGGLRGYIYDVERPGKKTESCGSEFELIETIEPEQIKAYGMDQLSAFAQRLNEDAPPDKQVTAEKLWERHPWEPFDFDEEIKPLSIDELKKMFSKSGGATAGGGHDEDSDDRYEDDSGVDADIPY